MTDDEAVDCLFQLVSIPSVTGNEHEAVRFMQGTLVRHGLSVQTDSVGNGIAKTGTGSKRLTFLGHIDTVPGFPEPRMTDGRIYGRGAVDAKGPLAAAMVAAVRARDTAGLEVIAAVGEEGPSVGARHIAQGPAPDALIVGEPGGSESIVLGYKGSMRASIRLSMPVTHTAGQAQMVSDVAVDAWTRIREVCRELSRGETNFERLTPTLLSFNTSGDGMTQNAEQRASFRLPVGLELDQARERISAAARPGTIEFDEADPAYRADRGTGLVASFLRSIRNEELKPRFKVKTGTSDMNVAAPIWQCPCVAYGPGDSSLDHTPEEHIPIDEFLTGVRVLTRVFQDWGKA